MDVKSTFLHGDLHEESGDSFLLESGFSRCHSDNTVYTNKVGKSLIILVLYVHDLNLTGSDPNLINHVKSSLKNKFEMTDLGHTIFSVFKSCNPRKVFSSPNPSMSVIFYAFFTWKIVSQILLPFSLESNFQSIVLPLKLMLPYIINL